MKKNINENIIENKVEENEEVESGCSITIEEDLKKENNNIISSKNKISDYSIIELIQLESAARLLYSINENEYITFRGQLSPTGVKMYKDSLDNMEKKVKKYGKIRQNLLQEIGLRIEEIETIFENGKEENETNKF